MKAGLLIHTAKFYKVTNKQGFAGATENSLRLAKTVKCHIDDITYQNKEVGNKNILDTSLKMTTRYFPASLDMVVKINKDKTMYKIIYIENVNFKNQELIFSLVKYEGK